eukprot:2060641-Alexandrium_andersonii.AAC.1
MYVAGGCWTGWSGSSPCAGGCPGVSRASCRRRVAVSVSGSRPRVRVQVYFVRIQLARLRLFALPDCGLTLGGVVSVEPRSAPSGRSRLRACARLGVRGR